jgi:hypothetical protein
MPSGQNVMVSETATAASASTGLGYEQEAEPG